MSRCNSIVSKKGEDKIVHIPKRYQKDFSIAEDVIVISLNDIMREVGKSE